jgi:hypothetical protein
LYKNSIKSSGKGANIGRLLVGADKHCKVKVGKIDMLAEFSKIEVDKKNYLEIKKNHFA